MGLAQGSVYIKKMSTPSVFVFPGGGKAASFTVLEWLPGTTPQDKDKVTWLLQDGKRQEIIVKYQGSGPRLNFFSLSKKLAGAQKYYLEATLSGKPDLSRDTGASVRAYCEPRITSSKWSLEEDGPDIRKKKTIQYGEDINLGLVTEGLNGYRLEVEVWSRKWGFDKLIKTYPNVDCVNGEVSVKMPDTFNWFSLLNGDRTEREFYVQVRISGKKEYIIDNFKDPEHARFLKVEGVIYNRTVRPASNNSLPVKIGEKDLNVKRHEPCSFTQLEIVDDGKKFLLFDEGKLQLKGVKKTNFDRSDEIYYDYNKWAITSRAKPVLNKLAAFLLESPYVPVELGSHTDLRGTAEYNMELSLKRANSAVEYLVAQGISRSRIKSKGYGETMPVVRGEKLTEEQHQQNRRTTILFKVFENDAQSIVYETIAGDTTLKKELPLTIKALTKKGCTGRSPHSDTKVRVIELTALTDDVNPKYELTVSASQIKPKVYSALAEVERLPFIYIWPRANAANKFLYYINTCRYFSNKERASVAIVAYPDIKWNFHMYLNLSNAPSVKWSNLGGPKLKEMQAKAGKIGAEERWKQAEVDFGVTMEANWNKKGDVYGGHVDGTLNFKAKIKKMYEIFAALKQFTKAVTSVTKGKVSKTRLGKVLPFSIVFNPPNFCMGAEWKLERGQVKGQMTNEIGTYVKFYFLAKPLFEMAINIDLLCLAVTAIGTAGGNPTAGKVFNEFRSWLEDEDHSIRVKMYIDLEIKGSINGAADIEINTVSDNNKLKAKISTTLSAEVVAAVEVEGVVVIVAVEAYVKGEAKASGIASITFGHSVRYDEKGLNYRPELMFDGLKVKFVFKVDVGMSVKKGKIKGSKSNMNLVDYQKEVDMIPEFDVIKNLETLAGVSADIPLMRKNDN